jgi:hypothetical protein
MDVIKYLLLSAFYIIYTIKIGLKGDFKVIVLTKEMVFDNFRKFEVGRGIFYIFKKFLWFRLIWPKGCLWLLENEKTGRYSILNENERVFLLMIKTAQFI